MEAAVFVDRQTWSFNPPWLFIWCVVLEKDSFSELHFIILEKSEGIRDNDVKDLTWAPELCYSALDAHRLWNSDAKAAAQASSTTVLRGGAQALGTVKAPQGVPTRTRVENIWLSTWGPALQLRSTCTHCLEI